uniref:Cytochrome b n=1 Tax=Capillidium heterosporum TaxID=1167838 RepID=A0A451F210_9FUNG|nr:apocytochrome b [Capillidium heterosporum]AZZ06693.1 apocytochrome b [Capillidium heterosporum]
MVKLLKNHSILSIANSYIIDSPSPSNLTYLWSYGSLLGVVLVIQIITGVTLAMHYTPNIEMAFKSVEHIMRDVNNGWLIRYTHANVASFFFIFLYIHIARGLYYGSYTRPRVLLWSIGVIIFVLTMATGFLGYTLPWGQMSLWGATVITNLLSAIPWIGVSLVEFVWGGFSVDNATLNRFFSLHYLLPFVLVGLVVLHLIALHEHGSNNPLGVSANIDRVPFHPYYTFKDIVGFLAFFLVLSIIVFYMPNLMGHPDNYIPANPLVTPTHIQPEWYFLPYYAILRSIPNKLLGVIAMFAAILILLAMPFLDTSRVRGSQFRPLMKIIFWLFLSNFVLLGWIGAKPVSEPYITIGQNCSILYFAWFLIVPIVGILENTIYEMRNNK